MGVRSGVIAGFISVLYTLIFYWIDKKMMLGALVYWSSLIFFVAAMIWAVLRVRRQRADGISTMEALRPAFLCFVVADLIFYAFYYLIFQIDPTMEEVAASIAMEALQQAKASGATEIFNQKISEYEKNLADYNYGVNLTMIFGKLAYGVIGGFILSLMIAMALREK